MEYEKLTYTNERGESVELSTESVYHCNVSKDVEGIAGVTNVVYTTNSMGQHIKPRTGRGILLHSLQTVFSQNRATGCK